MIYYRIKVIPLYPLTSKTKSQMLLRIDRHLDILHIWNAMHEKSIKFVSITNY